MDCIYIEPSKRLFTLRGVDGQPILFQMTEDSDPEPLFFDDKRRAKKFREAARREGVEAFVTFGPDHHTKKAASAAGVSGHVGL